MATWLSFNKGGYGSEYITYLLAIINPLPYKLVILSNYCPCFVHALASLIPKSPLKVNGGKSLKASILKFNL